MKTAIKLTTGILAVAVMASGAWAQNADAIDNARSVAKSLQQNQTTGAKASVVATSAKPAPGAPAPAVNPAFLPVSKPVAVASAPATEEASASAENKLQRVN